MAKPINEIHERISDALNIRGMKQQDLTEKTGIPKPSISQYISGYAKPKSDRIHLIAKALGVSEPWLLGYDVPMDKPVDPTDGITNLIYPSVRPIPILGTICAGNGIWCEDNFDGMFYIDNSVKADLCLKVKGDSMIEAGINDGDYAFIKKDYGFMNGKIYAVRINSDCEAVLKKVNIQGQNIILSPCNCEYEPIIDSCENVSIIGECIGSYHVMK
ncbi:LexA family protein [Eubacteriales bacterium KG125]